MNKRCEFTEMEQKIQSERVEREIGIDYRFVDIVDETIKSH